MSEKIPLLVLNTHSSEHRSVRSEFYDLTYAPTKGKRAAAIAAHGAKFRAVLTIGVLGVTAKKIAAMPALALVCCMGAGYELVDLDAARARGTALANGQGTNDDCVADHAFGLVIAALIQFLIVAAVVYFALVMPINHLSKIAFAKQKRAAEATPADVPPTETELLIQIRDLLAGTPSPEGDHVLPTSATTSGAHAAG